MGFNMRKINLVLAMVATSITLTFCSDPSPLQDFCVADSMSNVLVNGFVCKDPKMVTDKDFFLSGLLAKQRTIETNAIGSTVTAANVANIPGLNTLGISLARIDFEPNGLNPPHVHPRATEILTLLQGKLEVGFVTSNPDNRLIARVLEAGDVFVFPVGLVHFQINRGRERAVALAALSSQNPGVVNIANALFASNPPIDGDVLSKAFQLEQKVVDYLLDRSWTNNNN